MSTGSSVNGVLEHMALSWQVMPTTALARRHPLELTLRRHAEAIMVAGERRGLAVPYIGAAPLFSGMRLYHGPETDWALMPMEEDPEVQSRDGLAVWQSIIDELRAMVGAGLDFPAIYTAHEVAPGTVQEGRPIPQGAFAAPTSAATARLSARLGAVAGVGLTVAAAPLVASAAIAAGAIVAGAAVASVGLALGSAVATYDPMLFGAVVAPGRPVVDGELAAWFVLAQWNYAEEPK